MELKDVVKTRMSVNNFDSSFTINKQVIDEIISLNSLAPSAFNMQHAFYHVILDSDVKQAFYNDVCDQYKVLSASAVILVTGALKPHYKAKELISEKMYNMIDETYSDLTYAKEDAIRNASLSAMQFMLIAKDRGFDTCPMTGFDFDSAAKFFNLKDEIPVLLITIGKEDINKKKVRAYRNDIKDFVKYY